MQLVEVVAHDHTDSAVVDRAVALMEAWGKVPVRSADSPGFIVNRVNRPFTIEALRLVEAGDASVASVDKALRAAGYPMGPFELMDLVGIDVNLAAATAVWEGLGRPDRLRPSPIQERLVEAGRLGRKTGAGFYVHERGAAPTPAEEFVDISHGTADADVIVARIRAVIAAEAMLAKSEGVADEASINLALRLGAGHPHGPFERPETTT